MRTVRVILSNALAWTWDTFGATGFFCALCISISLMHLFRSSPNSSPRHMQYFRPEYKKDLQDLFRDGYKATKADSEAAASCTALYGAKWISGAIGGAAGAFLLLRMRSRMGEQVDRVITKFRPQTIYLVSTLVGGYANGTMNREDCFEIFLNVDSPMGEMLRKRAAELDPESLRKVQVVTRVEGGEAEGMNGEKSYGFGGSSSSSSKKSNAEDSEEKVYEIGGASRGRSFDLNEVEEQEDARRKRYFDDEDDEVREQELGRGGFDRRNGRDPRARRTYYDYGGESNNRRNGRNDDSDDDDYNGNRSTRRF